MRAAVFVLGEKEEFIFCIPLVMVPAKRGFVDVADVILIILFVSDHVIEK